MKLLYTLLLLLPFAVNAQRLTKQATTDFVESFKQSTNATEARAKIGLPVPVKIILSTDPGGDPDDTGDLSYLHALIDEGLVECLAIVAPQSNWWTMAIIDDYNQYWGHDIPIGKTLQSRPNAVATPDTYGSYSATNFQNRWFNRNGRPEIDSVVLLRSILAQQANHSVIWVDVGPPTALHDLMDSVADVYSPLNGTDLVNVKIKFFSFALGEYPYGPEYNLATAIDSSVKIHALTNPIVFIGFSFGSAFETMSNYWTLPPENPARMAFTLGLAGSPNTNCRPAWGSVAIRAAIDGWNNWGAYSVNGPPGTNHIGNGVAITQWYSTDSIITTQTITTGFNPATNYWCPITGSANQQIYLITNGNTAPMISAQITEMAMRSPKRPGMSNNITDTFIKGDLLVGAASSRIRKIITSNIDGSGVISSGTNGILSCTRSELGYYKVNFFTPLTTTNYVVQVTPFPSQIGAVTAFALSNTTSSVTIRLYDLVNARGATNAFSITVMDVR